MAIDKSDFRHCMGRFATGITVITTKTKENKYCGMTINSFSSLSLEPALVLFSIDKNAHNHDNFTNSDKFTINILSDNQIVTSKTFAHPSSIDWNEIDYKIGENGCPVIDGTIANISCVIEDIYQGGDHSILVSRVTHLEQNSDADPLLYYKGKYRKIGEKL